MERKEGGGGGLRERLGESNPIVRREGRKKVRVEGRRERKRVGRR